MIQVLSLRKSRSNSFTDRVHFDLNVRANNIQELFTKMQVLVDQFPENERYNLFYTVAECYEEVGRKLLRQNAIPFDIDDTNPERVDDYLSVFEEVTHTVRNNLGIVNSGNGLQIIVMLEEYFVEEEFFEKNKVYYNMLCSKLNMELKRKGLVGELDTSVFSPARLMRMGYTKNDKTDKGKGIKDAVLLYNELTPYRFNLKELSGCPDLNANDFMHPNALAMLPEPDAIGILNGCEFIKWCRENPSKVSEPQWYALLSILGHLEGGRKICHEYSEGHPNYSAEETDRKIDQAITASGPRLCRNIALMFEGCNACMFKGKVNCPITIKREKYIATRNTGFYLLTEEGKRGKPCYDDLMLYFEEQHPFVTLSEASIPYVFEDGKWHDITKAELHQFAENNFNPKPNTMYCKEFEAKICRNNVVNLDFFKVSGKVNFKNGVLDLESMKLEPHNPAYGFTYKLPFDYNPEATCPRFSQFLQEVTAGDQESINILIEFIGVTLMAVPNEIVQKALILEGDGSNGKSVLTDVLAALAGDGNWSAIKMGADIAKAEYRYQLAGKLCNISEETPQNALQDTSVFKNLVTGGKIQVRKYYHSPYEIKNNAKLILLCNRLPYTSDDSYGMYRRLLIVPFEQSFKSELGNKDPHLRGKLMQELSGIFNLAYQGYLKFKVNSTFSACQKSERAVDEFKGDDAHTMWLRDNLEPCVGEDMLGHDELYRKYSFEIKELGYKPLAINHLMRKAKLLFRKLEIRRKGTRRYISGYKLITEDETNEREI